MTTATDPLSVFLATDLVKAISEADAMSPLERVEELLELLNASVPLVSRGQIRRHVMGGGAATNEVVAGALSTDFRAELVEWLEQIISDRHVARELLAPQLKQLMREIVFVPFADDSKPGFKVRHVAVSRNYGVALRYAASLLLDDDLKLGVRLKRCRLKACGKFFLQEDRTGRGSGKPAYLYCSRLHQQRADRLKSAERVSRYRKRLASQKSRRPE